jgi:hypothetical protein
LQQKERRKLKERGKAGIPIQILILLGEETTGNDAQDLAHSVASNPFLILL